MEAKPANKAEQLPVVAFFQKDNVKKKFEEMLGKKAQGFITSVLQIATSNEQLKTADPISIYNSAAIAATLDLPINNSLGSAYIVPFRKDGVSVAQFQIGYKGFIQLAQRSGLFKTISASPIYEGQLISEDPLKGFVFDFTKKKSEKIVGYAAYFELLNGFEKTLYMSVEQVKAHGQRYSQTFKKGFGVWKDNFEAMAIKTVLKRLLSVYAPLSIEMQKAVIADQAIIKSDNPDFIDAEYEDETKEQSALPVSKEDERIFALIEKAKTKADLAAVENELTSQELLDAYNAKLYELSK